MNLKKFQIGGKESEIKLRLSGYDKVDTHDSLYITDSCGNILFYLLINQISSHQDCGTRRSAKQITIKSKGLPTNISPNAPGQRRIRRSVRRTAEIGAPMRKGHTWHAFSDVVTVLLSLIDVMRSFLTDRVSQEDVGNWRSYEK